MHKAGDIPRMQVMLSGSLLYLNLSSVPGWQELLDKGCGLCQWHGHKANHHQGGEDWRQGSIQRYKCKYSLAFMEVPPIWSSRSRVETACSPRKASWTFSTSTLPPTAGWSVPGRFGGWWWWRIQVLRWLRASVAAGPGTSLLWMGEQRCAS